MNFEDRNIYCARNYCANLLKIALVEKDVEVLKEFYYTSVYTAKTILGSLEKYIVNLVNMTTFGFFPIKRI